MAASAVGDVKENSMHQPLLSGVIVWAGVFSQYRTALHLVNGTVTSQYYLNNRFSTLPISSGKDFQKTKHMEISPQTTSPFGYSKPDQLH